MPRMISGREFMEPAEVAEMIGVSPRTLSTWRSEGTSPAFVRLYGGKTGPVLYDAEGVRLWIAARFKESRLDEKLAAARAAVGDHN